MEPSLPVIKKEEGSEDLQSPGRSSAIEVKVECEEKPKNSSPFVFVEEENMGHDKYYGTGVPSLTAKAKKQWTPKQVSETTTREPTVPEGKKKKHIKMKAPTEEDTIGRVGGEARRLVALHGHFKELVGEIPPKEVSRHLERAAVPGLGSSAGSHDGSSPRSQYESATSSMVSALMDTVGRMQLGPTGAALLEARVREAGKMDAAIPRAQPQVRVKM
ncbi:unnamed protein product [Peronospora effusa]|nr:unnamed protein product [Peronospora effusa]